MPIREALTFIRGHGRGLTHEILVDQLRKKGYSEDEVEEALYIAKTEGLLGAKPLKEFEKSMRPTLWNAVAERAGEEKKTFAEKKPENDWTRAVKTMGFWIGVFFPGAFYYFSLSFFTFLELFFAPFLELSVPVAITLVLSGILYFILKNESPNFAAGLPAGIALLFSWSVLNSSII